jgi:hypothetical protein
VGNVGFGPEADIGPPDFHFLNGVGLAVQFIFL